MSEPLKRAQHAPSQVVAIHPARVENFRDFESAEARSKRLAGLAAWLREIADAVEEDGFERDPHALLIAFISQDGPELGWKGIKTYDELNEIRMEIDDHYILKYGGTRRAVSSVTRRRQQDKEHALQRQVYLDEHPWLCEHGTCGRRFKTEAGAKIHERSCYHGRRYTQPGR